MSGNRKVPASEKLRAVKEYLEGNGSCRSIAKKYGVTITPFRKWVAKYKAFGDSAFIPTGHNATYTTEFKTMVAKAYLNEEGSLQDLAIKYKIPTQDTVRLWILKYNGHEKLKSSGTGGNLIMTKARITTYDERIEIVKYCIENQNDYAETAKKFQVSYQQVYSWTNKYSKYGVESLQDRRGKRKCEDEMSEIEKLRAQNKLLEAENKQKQMEIDLLKKLEEIERGRS